MKADEKALELAMIRRDIWFLAHRAAMSDADTKALKQLQSSIVKWLQKHGPQS